MRISMSAICATSRQSALISGADGLDAIRRIVADAHAHLHPGARLLIEHGWDQAEHVRAMFAAAGYADIGSARDAAGHERVTFGAKPG